MTAGFWLRVNDKWMPLEGVQAGVPISPDRPSSELVTLGGRRSVSRAKRVAREWSLDFTHATPEAVRLFALAAQGQAGDVMLLDLSATRANMLDPLACVGPSSNPLVDCDGLPLRSVTVPSSTTETYTALLSANAVLQSASPDASGSFIQLRSTPAIESLIKVGVPPDPIGRTFASARLSMAQAYTPVGATITAYAASNAWVDGVTWNTAPAAGSSVGSGGPDASFRYSIALSGVGAFRGSTMSLRLKSNSSTLMTIWPRDAIPANRPQLEITYSVATGVHPFSSTLRAGVAYTLSAFTDITAGSQVLTYNIGAGDVVVNAPAGAGWRLVTATFTPSGDAAMVGSVTAAPVSGLRLTEGAHLGSWVPGQKTPCRVSIPDPEQTLNYLLNGQQGRSDYRVIMREVG